MPAWFTPVLIVVAAGALIAILDSTVRNRQSPRAEDNHWTAGIFYANREDPRLIVPKRLGIGRTLNFGHSMAWVLVLAPVIVAVAASTLGR